MSIYLFYQKIKKELTMKKITMLFVTFLLFIVQISFADMLPNFEMAGINCGQPLYANGRFDSYNVTIRNEKITIKGVVIPVKHYIIDNESVPYTHVNALNQLNNVPVSVLRNMEIISIGKNIAWLMPKGTVLTTYERGSDNSWVIDAVNCQKKIWIQLYIPGPSTMDDNLDTLRTFGLAPGTATGYGKLTHKIYVSSKTSESSAGLYSVDRSYAFYEITTLSSSNYYGYFLLTMSKVTGDTMWDTQIFNFNIFNTLREG
jgi:hypothetical protein